MKLLIMPLGTLYTYNGRNRLINIENPQNNISTNEQNIVFNSFKRPETISEGDFELNYTYGPDQERIKGEWKNNGAAYRERRYASNYEINIENNITHQICYISSPSGLCAMYVTEIPLPIPIGTGGAGVGQLHYTYTDNLGSILAVTSEAGTVIARQNFDAWGRRRNAQNYDYLNQNTTAIHNGLPGISSSGLPSWLFRGYTGHEMLDDALKKHTFILLVANEEELRVLNLRLVKDCRGFKVLLVSGMICGQELVISLEIM